MQMSKRFVVHVLGPVGPAGPAGRGSLVVPFGGAQVRDKCRVKDQRWTLTQDMPQHFY